MIMENKYLYLLLFIVLAAGVAGCTTTSATDVDRYGNYLNEMNSGNADFSSASLHYDEASRNFTKGGYYKATAAIRIAENDYANAMQHYKNMTVNATNKAQLDYADALYAYAQNCMYASMSYQQAYQSYMDGKNEQGKACVADAARFIEKANECHEQAVALQPAAIR